ncbi:MAG TPA: PQQ-binding-like beta-propeller repeat protein, partial [Planctomycetota bacterium]|nr:PQQ-binding-like beta-propeller repeat protein [Planctomycetota bacterium]
MRKVLVALGVMTLTCAAFAQTVGWRGNWTGLYPDADPPTEWGRINRGVTTMTFCSAAKPAGPQKAGQPLDKGLIREWLVIGPFPVEDTVKDFDTEQIPGEASLEPDEGMKIGELAWKRLELEKQPDYVRWGTTELERLDVDKTFGKTRNRIVYAHTWLYCEKPGKAAFVVDHHFGLKLWVNGKAVYGNPKKAEGFSNYVSISRQKKGLVHYRSPKVEIELKQGWNRLLVKVSTYNLEGWWGFGFAQRLVDVEPVAYDEKNIAWMTKLPERTNGAPIIVGDRIFTTADPDVLVCLDKKTGKILWKRFNSYYHATPANERAANPAFAEKVAPLVAELEKTDDEDRNLELRREIHKLLVEIDKEKYDPKWDGHFESHFGIMGFSTTPVSDGKNVYVFFGHGVAASYDLDGNRRWIRRIVPKQLAYTCSPAIIDDVFVVFMEKMIAYRKDTGETVWEQPGVQGSIASLIPARIHGV